MLGDLQFLKGKIDFTKDLIPELLFFPHTGGSETFTLLKKMEDKILLYSETRLFPIPL